MREAAGQRLEGLASTGAAPARASRARRPRWRGAAVAAALLAAAGAAQARLPAAHVVEVADWREGFPAPCPDAAVRDRSLHVSARLARAVQAGGGPGVEVVGPLRRLEEATRIVLVRSMEGCRAIVARGKLPGPPRVEAVLGQPLGLRGWRAEPDATLVLSREGAACRVQRGHGACLGVRPTPEQGCPARLHYYGVLPLYLEGETRDAPPREVAAGDAASGRFAGQGDRARYRVRVPGPGSLLVEYRSDAGPGSIGVGIRDGAGRSLGSGMATLHGAGELLVTLTHLGSGPAAYDVGFLFTPERPFACTTRVRPLGGRRVRATVEVTNRGRTRHPAALPGTGTVTWLLEGEVLAGAHPGRPPRTVFLEPGERRSHSVVLELPPGADAAGLRAAWRAGPRLTLDCAPAR